MSIPNSHNHNYNHHLIKIVKVVKHIDIYCLFRKLKLMESSILIDIIIEGIPDNVYIVRVLIVAGVIT
jgi:hypothetical protein